MVMQWKRCTTYISSSTISIANKTKPFMINSFMKSHQPPIPRLTLFPNLATSSTDLAQLYPNRRLTPHGFSRTYPKPNNPFKPKKSKTIHKKPPRGRLPKKSEAFSTFHHGHCSSKSEIHRAPDALNRLVNGITGNPKRFKNRKSPYQPTRPGPAVRLFWHFCEAGDSPHA